MNRSDVRLAYKIFTPSDSQPEVHRFHHAKHTNEFNSEHPPVILLHGITNTKETWDSCGQTIANRTNTKVYSLDARNHGDSGWTDKIDYINMAEDIALFMDSMGIPTAILIGHSMGGKTAMRFAVTHPSRLHSMIIEDMSINVPQTAEDYVRHYLIMLREVLDKIPPQTDLIEAKRIAALYLTSPGEKGNEAADSSQEVWDGRDLPLRLKPDGGGFEWKTNLDAIERSILRDEFTPPNLLDDIYEGPVLIIYGTHSPLNVLSDKESLLKQFPNAAYEAVKGATHSIHIEYPDTFTELVCHFILKHRHLKSSF